MTILKPPRLRRGDVIGNLDGARVLTAQQLLQALADHRTASPVSLEIRTLEGVRRSVAVPARQVPVVVSPDDRTLLANTLAAAYRYRAATETNPIARVAFSLNLASMLIRLEDFAGAADQLRQIIASPQGNAIQPQVADAISATSQYLLGVAADAMKNFDEAQRALLAARAYKGSLLLDDETPATELADRKLADLRARMGR